MTARCHHTASCLGRRDGRGEEVSPRGWERGSMRRERGSMRHPTHTLLHRPALTFLLTPAFPRRPIIIAGAHIGLRALPLQPPAPLTRLSNYFSMRALPHTYVVVRRMS